MKKVLAMILAATMMLLTFAGCASDQEGSSAAGTDGSTAKLKIGIVMPMEHPSLNTIKDSFLEELAALGYDESKVEIIYENAQSDQNNLNTICSKFVGDKVDLIVAIATQAAQSAVAATSDIPVLFSAVTDPVKAKLMTDLSKPDRNATGTSDAIPVDQVFELCKKLTPDVKKFGFLYTSSEPNSESVIEQAKELAPKYGYEFEVTTITNTSELNQAAQSLAGKVDAIYTPIDNPIAMAMATLTDVGIENKIPVYVGADSMVNDGGFATVGIDYTVLGKQTAAMAKKILEGTPVSEIPVETMTNFATVINKTTAEKIGVTIPEDIAKDAVIAE